MEKNKDKNFHLKCHKCEKEIPFLHPHIMLERNDDKGNLICEDCYQKSYINKEKY